MLFDRSEREAKSQELLRQLSARIDLAADAAALKAIGKEITPQVKSRMLPADVATLREKYQGRESALNGSAQAA